MSKIPLINRDISWLSFNERVLQEAEDETTPVIERLKFLGIFSNNRDEFYRVRVASLKRLAKIKKQHRAYLNELLATIQSKALEQQHKFEKIYQELLVELEKHDVFIINEREINHHQKKIIRDHFHVNVISNLFPILIDEKNPFPQLKDKSSYLYLKLENNKKIRFALIEIPTSKVSRFFVFPREVDRQYIIMLDDVIRFNSDELFEVHGYKVLESYNIKITRDAEPEMDSEVGKSVLQKISKMIKDRKKGLPVRFVYDVAMPPDMLKFMIKNLKLNKKENAIPGGRYHNFKDFINFPDLGDPRLIYQRTAPIEHRDLMSVFQTTLKSIKEKDILLHYPYHSFNHVITLLREASLDPSVESIKMTIYRLSDSSKIANALINAVKNGKNVTVIIELQARFDEENNLFWSKKLRENGAKVIFGVPGLKVHSKLILITTRVKGVAFYYSHVGTGNFNEKSAMIYSDFSVLTAHQGIGKDIEKVFDFYRDPKKIPKFSHILVAPQFMRHELMKLMEFEIEQAKNKKTAKIFLKMNSLVDQKLIEKLYEAHNAGVEIKMIIRGPCSLVTELKNWSEEIKCFSLVDKYLEHGRVFIFHHGGRDKMYLSSGDWMSRNLDYRSEVAIPIFDKHLKNQIKEIMKMQLKDNLKLRYVDKYQTNQYKKLGLEKILMRVQDETFHYLAKENES